MFCRASAGLAEKNLRSHTGILICKISVAATLEAAVPRLRVASVLGRAYSQAHGPPWQCQHRCSSYPGAGLLLQRRDGSAARPLLSKACSPLGLEQPQGW